METFCFCLKPALRGKGRLLAAMTTVILVLLAGFVVAAYHMTGPVRLTAGESLNRAAYPAPGSYTLSAVGGEGVQVSIRSQNKHETMMHTHTELYSGALNEAQFTVPEDSMVVYFVLTAKQDTRLEQVLYSGDAGQGSLPLNYLLLPDFISNRLQGLFANQNAIQRTVFFNDGMKVFWK